MKTILDIISNENKLRELAVDFNLDLLSYGTDIIVQDLVSLLDSSLSFCSTAKPARICQKSETLAGRMEADQLQSLHERNYPRLCAGSRQTLSIFKMIPQ